MVSKPLTIGSAIRAATAFWCRSANDSPLSRAGEDIVGRLGGDEFLIVGSAQQPAAQQAYVTSLRQALCGVYFLGEQRIDYEGASFGVVTCDPQSIDVEAALRAADEAMYRDKKSCRRENFIHID